MSPAFLLAQEAGPAFSLQLVLGAGQPSKLLGTGEFTELVLQKAGMSNNPFVARVRSHLLRGNYLRVLEGPPLPPQLPPPWIIKARV